MISLSYFAILILSVVLYWIIPKQTARNALLILSSFAFIYLMDRWSVVVVLALTLLSYACGRLIDKYPKRAWIHTLGVILVLAVLVVFKYLGFLGGIFNSLAEFSNLLPRFEIKKLLLPLGISYIVFKHISYLTDIKWGLVKPGRFVDFLLYSSLFTIFVAGPIERFERFKPQVEEQIHRLGWIDFDFAVFRVFQGILKKKVIADWLAFVINPILDNHEHYSLWIRVLALLGYSFQIYFDFSGYSDIALGSSRLFGLRIMENFNNPYLAPNISQFWRRWHVSLSDWIRDYVFFPLSRLGKTKIWHIFFVPITSMALCGLWHGTTWHYILWGVWHGLGLSLFQFWSIYKRQHKKLQVLTNTRSSNYISVTMSYSYVALGWCLFYLPISEIGSFISPISDTNKVNSIISLPSILLILSTTLVVFVAVPLVSYLNRLKEYDFYSPRHTTTRWILIACIIWLLIFASKSNGQSFIYLGF